MDAFSVPDCLKWIDESLLDPSDSMCKEAVAVDEACMCNREVGDNVPIPTLTSVAPLPADTIWRPAALL